MSERHDDRAGIAMAAGLYARGRRGPGRATALACVLLAWLAPAARGADEFRLRDGDRVLFYGDSITEQGLYTAIVETYVATRYPGLDVTSVNAGWSGDTVRGGAGGPADVRLARDVLPQRPTVMTIMLGMNDRVLSLGADGASDQQFLDGYAHLIGRVRADLPGARITALMPSPYDEVTRPPRPEGDNAVLVRFGRWIEGFAGDAGLGVADMNAPLVRVLERAKEVDPERAKGIIPDRVHPGLAGALVMAEQLLKAWDARPVVATVTIDTSGPAPAVSSAEHSSVSGLSAGEGLSWTQLDDALPLPFAAWARAEGDAPAVALVIRCSDMTAALNEQALRVAGLAEGRYALRIDDAPVGTFTGAELAAGVELGALATPMAAQAERVHALTFAHGAVHRARWRQVEVRLAGDDLPEKGTAVEALDGLEAALVARQHEAARPVPHRFELVPSR
jgi:lysophospholipase L1-like esterase